MPSFASRVYADELMDDFAIADARLTAALENLRQANRWLGGHAATMRVLVPFLRRQAGRRVRVLDLATGCGDFPEYLARWAAREGLDVEVVGLEANPVTVDYARAALQRRLSPAVHARVRIVEGDALALAYDDDAFDVAVTSLFMHHLTDEEAVRLLANMERVGRHGLVVNDLHRHPLAYYGFALLARLLPVSPMFRHDGPVSILRAFRRDELQALARQAGLSQYQVHWCWAFRWILSTLPPG
jgi:ubiquinone/menaquinone biosynthesis C-methylase UbiE